MTTSRRKNRTYVITLVSRYNRQIIGYDVAYDKGWKRIQKLVDKAPKAYSYYSYVYLAYSEVCYEDSNISLNNKSQTYTVEGVNSDLRHYIKALHRSSKCVFRSVEIMKAVLKIFVNVFNLFASSKRIYPHLKSSFFLINFIQPLSGHSQVS